MFNFHIGGNPILELLEVPNTDIDKLLDIQSFPAEFRSCNPQLEKYMDMSKYNRLVEYITEVGDPDNRTRSYKYPMIAAEILSIDNSKTLEALLEEQKTTIEKIQTEEIWVEKEVDQCDSEYHSSGGSSRESKKNADDFFENEDRQNIPPRDDINENRRFSIGSKKKTDETQDNQLVPQIKSKRQSTGSITLDDFPHVEENKKKIKVKQVLISKKMIEVKPLLHQLFKYFEKQMNYTLTGYVTKVLEMVLRKNPRRILKQIFTTTIHKNLVKQIDSQCVCQLIINILLCVQNEVENGREYFVESLLKTFINSSSDEQKNMQNKSILYILTELISKLDPQSSKWHMVLMLHIYQQPSMSKLASFIFDQKTTHHNKDKYAQLFIHCMNKIINPIIINTSNTVMSNMKTVEQQNIKQFRQQLIGKFETYCKEIVEKIWENLMQLQEKLQPSYVYLRQLEILNILIKNNMYWSRMQLSNQEKIFDILMQVCKKFNNNTFIHNQVFELLKEIVYISDKLPLLFTKTFNCKNFIGFCQETLSEDIGKQSPQYKGQCIYLCEAIRHCNSEVGLKFKEEQKQKWEKVENIMMKNVQKINSTLGGFSIRKPNSKPEILFNKESTFSKFSYFLKGQIPLENNKNIENHELEEIDSKNSTNGWTDWSQFTNYNADQVDEKNKEEQHKLE